MIDGSGPEGAERASGMGFDSLNAAVEDGTLGGYLQAHGRPPAFEGPVRHDAQSRDARLLPRLLQRDRSHQRGALEEQLLATVPLRGPRGLRFGDVRCRRPRGHGGEGRRARRVDR